MTVLSWVLLAGASFAQTLESVTINVGETVTAVSLDFDKDLMATPNFFTLEQGTPRFVIDFKKAATSIKGNAIGNGQRMLPGDGGIKQVRYARHGQEDLRLVFDLHDAVQIQAQSINADTVDLTFGNPAQAIGVTTSMPTTNNEVLNDTAAEVRQFADMPQPRLQPSPDLRSRKKPVIVIDPGHGGYDPGAIGKNGTHEKDLTFDAAKELRLQLMKTGRYDVLLTRGDDVYVNHEDRLRSARVGGADLFISLHADSAGSAAARGASVYTLADRAKSRSRNVVSTQNWVMEVDLNEQTDPVGNILLDLAQRKTFSQSAKFADILLSELKQSTHLVGNSHRRAGYFVLLAPDVPAVLLEMGFLSNVEDETLLNKKKHRIKMMTSVTKAINTYFDNEKP